MDVKDFNIDQNNDLIFLNGDIDIDYSDNQHIQDIVYSFQGYWKQNPTCGVGIQQYLNSAGMQQKIKNDIKLQLENDNYTVDSISIETDGAIKIDASRNV